MEDFLILIVEAEWDVETVTPEDWEREAVLHRAFAQAVRDAGGEVTESNALAGNSQAVRIRKGQDGAPPVYTDGPFAETKEVVSGYYLITARDKAQALKLAELCPTAGYVEVHPILDLSDVM